MAVFVLVHGAWHGGWCWTRVLPLLRAGGHDVRTPTLIGLGDRAHLGGPGVGLETHIGDVVNLLTEQALTNVILVGHSYAGMVVRGVADRAPERIRCVVYLDAYVPEDGQSMAALRGWNARDLEAMRRQMTPAGSDWALPAPSSAMFDVKDAEDIGWADARLTPHPLRTFTDAIALGNPKSADVPAVYIICTVQEDGFESTAARCRARGWPVYELATGHSCMLTAPAELARILLHVAGSHVQDHKTAPEAGTLKWRG